MFEQLKRSLTQTNLTDAELHRAALAGNAEAMATLYRRHGGLVYRFTLRMSGDAAVAEEITQEVFLALLSRLDRFDAERALLSTWLCGIARRQLWKHLERNGHTDAMGKKMRRSWKAKRRARWSRCCGVRLWPRCEPVSTSCRRHCAR